jgi:hypothetical protein
VIFVKKLFRRQSKILFKPQNDDPSTERRMSNIDEPFTTTFNQNMVTEQLKNKMTLSIKSKKELHSSRKPKTKLKNEKKQ